MPDTTAKDDSRQEDIYAPTMSREEIDEYCRIAGVEFNTDPSHPAPWKLSSVISMFDANPVFLATEEETRADARSFYHDPRARLQIEQAMRVHKIFPPDGWAAIFAPDPVPIRKHQVARTARQAAQPMHSPLAREEGLATLQQAWAPAITGAIRHGIEQPTWYLSIAGRQVCLGSTRQLQDQMHVRGLLFEVTGRLIARIPQAVLQEWDTYLEALYAIAEVIDAPDYSLHGQAYELMACYLDSQFYRFGEDFDTDEWERCARRNMPYRHDGHIYVHARHWHGQYVHLMAPGITYKQCLEYLHALGGENTRVTVNSHPRSSRSYWRLPAGSILTEIVKEDYEDVPY